VELLVATTVMLAVLGTTGVFLATSRTRIQDQILRVETLQGLRSAMDTMVRDLRLGGACLPLTGDFITLDSVNSTTDQIFTRTGLVRPNQSCVRTALSADITASDPQLPVEAASGFQANMRAYIRHPNGTGEVFSITGVNTSTNVLTKSGALSQAYPATSGVYALDERMYIVDTSNPALPVLTLGVNGAAPVPFAFGIENLTLRYQLARNCPACDVVDLPASDTEFALVNQIFITLTARSLKVGSDGQYYRVSRTVAAKPRNLLPG
jgi:hypothetical protein